MASRTYLELCRALVAELGIAGGSGPSAVTGQTGELDNVTRWIAEADLYIQNLWLDWKFLWTAGPTAQTIAAGASTIATVTDLRTEIEDGLILFAGSTQAYRPLWMEWPDFRLQFGTRPKNTQSKPAHWTVRPDGVIELSSIVAANTAWTLEYQRQPVRMTSNTSTSPIPAAYDRLIMSRAAIMYGTREDAPEIQTGMAAEYDDLLEKLESACLPGQKYNRRAQNRGQPEPDFLGRGNGHEAR